MLKLITKVASATFLFALMLASEANAERRLPPCPKDRSVSWDNCHGDLTLTDGVEYVGEFKDGKLNGQGTYTWPNGEKYVGEFRDDLANGQGTHTKPDGEKFVGEFKDFKYNGQGTYTWPNGEKYVGEFRDSELNGQGTLTLPNGRKYVGEFKDGKPNGQGTQTWPDGVDYVGEFKDREPNGQGTYTWPNGEKFVGEFIDNKRNGPGTLYSSNGTVKQFGVWKDDILVGSSAENSSNKAITSALGLPEKMDGYLPPILLAIAAITAIAAIFLMKDRTELSIRVSSPTARDNEKESKMENDLENGPRPVGDAEMDAWRASLEPPGSVAKAELHNYPAPKTHEQNRTTKDNVALLEKLHDGFLKMTYQEKALYGAASVIALMLIFPPTLEFHSENYPYSGRYSTNSYDFIFSLPNNASVNIQVLLIQCFGVGLVAAILYFAASKKRNKCI